MKRIITFVLAAAILVGCRAEVMTPVELPPVKEQKAAIGTAGAFLALLDSGEFDETWEISSPVLTSNTTQNVWGGQLLAFRSSYSPFTSRKFKDLTFGNAVDGGPSGLYVSVSYDTLFGTEAVREKVVLRMEHGQWKVAGYFGEPLSEVKGGA